jgi:hypothetical protein
MMGTAMPPRGVSENRRTPFLAGPAQNHFFAPAESDAPMFSHTRQVASRDDAEVATQNASEPSASHFASFSTGHGLLVFVDVLPVWVQCPLVRSLCVWGHEYLVLESLSFLNYPRLPVARSERFV